MKLRIGVILTILAVLGSVVAMSPTAAVANTAGQLLVNGSGLCLGIQGSSSASGAKAEVGTCAPNSKTQDWREAGTTLVGGVIGFQLENDEDLCLGVSGGSTASGAQVVQGYCSALSDHSQIWLPEDCPDYLPCGGYYVAPGPGNYFLVNGHSGMCLGVQGSSPNSGSLVIQGTCNSFSLTQQWAYSF